MNSQLITAPVGLALSLAEARLAARVDADADGTSSLDGEIESAIITYTSEAEAETNRAIIEQTWCVTLDAFPASISLPRPRLLVVEHVKFYDVDGVLSILAAQDYFVDTASEPGCLMPAPGRRWPDTAKRKNAVQIQYRCGYGADHTSVPASIKGFLRARIAEQFNTGKHADNKNVTRLLWRDVVYGC